MFLVVSEWQIPHPIYHFPQLSEGRKKRFREKNKNE
jgi:hypothetical protein